MADAAIAETLLVLFAREPHTGLGKRRIAEQLGNTAAHAVNSEMYAAALAVLNRWPGPAALALADPSTDADAHDTLSREHIRLTQPDGSFGARFQSVDRTLCAQHSGPRLYLGSDAPELSETFYRMAAEQLEHYDAVLAPAQDGGVTLLGTRCRWPALEHLPWGTNKLCEALEEACLNEGLSVMKMPVSADVDTLDDLLRLRRSLKQDTRHNQQQLLMQLKQILPDVCAVIPVKHDNAMALTLSEALISQGTDQVLIIDYEHNGPLAEACKQLGIRYQSNPSNRGTRLDAGARSFKGGNLWFLHADAKPAKTAIDDIRKHLLQYDAGCFRFQFSGPGSAGKYLLERTINWRAKHFVPYGDQGLFVKLRTYIDSGGFAHTPLFEEVPLIKHLKRHTRFAMLNTPIGVSTRRWQKDGWIKRTLHNRWLVIRYLAGASPESLAKSYTGQ